MSSTLFANLKKTAISKTNEALRLVQTSSLRQPVEASLFILGKGTVGTQLLSQIRESRAALLENHDINLRVVGIADSKGNYFQEEGIDLSRWEFEFAQRKTAAPLLYSLDRLRRHPLPILVDCTAADRMEDFYHQAFAWGIHVAAANKKPLAIASKERAQLMDAARRERRAYRYETTVGASLPVIDTVKDLVRTGDHIIHIEGLPSGTLNYLSYELSRGTPLVKAVEHAKAAGYTEPNPQEDLSGLDVARKALILARELGVTVDLKDVALEPFIPEALLIPMPYASFLQALAAYEQTVADSIIGLTKQGLALRYIAKIRPDAPKHQIIEVGPVGVPADHKAAQLRGTEVLVSFTTERHRNYPIVVRGAGAGGAVTASGVLSDVLRIATSALWT